MREEKKEEEEEEEEWEKSLKYKEDACSSTCSVSATGTNWRGGLLFLVFWFLCVSEHLFYGNEFSGAPKKSVGIHV